MEDKLKFLKKLFNENNEIESLKKYISDLENSVINAKEKYKNKNDLNSLINKYKIQKNKFFLYTYSNTFMCIFNKKKRKQGRSIPIT